VVIARILTPHAYPHYACVFAGAWVIVIANLARDGHKPASKTLVIALVFGARVEVLTGLGKLALPILALIDAATS